VHGRRFLTATMLSEAYPARPLPTISRIQPRTSTEVGGLVRGRLSQATFRGVRRES